MWSKLTLRLRIVLLCALSLLMVCAVLTISLVTSAGKTFAVPYGTLASSVPSVAVQALEYSARLAVPTEEGQTYGRMPMATLQLPSEFSERFVANATTAYETVQLRYSYQSYIWTAGIFIMGLLLIWFITGRALRPVASLSRQIEVIDANNLSEPLPLPKSGDELARLTVSFNHMLHKVSTAYEAQKRFAHNAAHELKTPVAAILAHIEVTELTEDASVEELREALDAAKANAKRMEVLIADMMALNAATDHSREAEFQFSALLADISAELEGALSDKAVTITCDGDLTLSGDRALLQCAFANIIHNAIRYNRQGGAIEISCRGTSVRICDTGIGIAPDMLDKVLEPFFCADPSRSKALGGSGLGLSIAKQIFDKHGMTMALSSGHGTTVDVFTNRSSKN